MFNRIFRRQPTISPIKFLRGVKKGSMLTLPQFDLVEGRFNRDGAVHAPHPPKAGREYLVSDIINLTSSRSDDDELYISVAELFPKKSLQLYLLAESADDQYPLIVSEHGYIAHHLVDHWMTEIYCCYRVSH